MGKSSSGKDTLYGMLMKDEELQLKRIVPYTTRPIREGEEEGVAYHFTDKAGLDKLLSDGKVIESRCYNTCHGDWYYFTVNDDSIDLDNNNYLFIGTLESYRPTREYFGNERIVPLYIDLDDGERLSRALARERMQSEPKYKELCRRFLADAEDFSDDKLEDLGIVRRFINNDLDECFDEIKKYILDK